MNRFFEVFMSISIWVVILGGLAAIWSLQNSNNKNNEPIKITFDFIDMPNGRLTRFYDCGTNIICYSAGGVLGCETVQQVPKVVSDRCDK